jgi:hypothetical protein
VIGAHAIPHKPASSSDAAALALCDGTVHVGSILERGGVHIPYDADGRLVGTFQTRTEAVHPIQAVRP